MNSALYRGTVTHTRPAGPRNSFTYPTCFFALDLDEVPALARRVRLFSHNRPNAVSFYDRDHMGRVDHSAKDNARAAAEDILGPGAAHRVVLVTNLRVLGYVFNPISWFYCYAADGTATCVLAEVSNTFGERHMYVLRDGERRGDRTHYSHVKRLHVSPFLPMGLDYTFAITEPGGDFEASIVARQDARTRLSATLRGVRHDLSDATIGRALARHPLMTHRVTERIHGQALRLWRGGARFYRKPPLDPGRGSVDPVPADEPRRRGLKPPPPARRTPLTPLARRATQRVLARPAVGRVTLELPDGTLRVAGRGDPDVRVRIRSRDAYRRIAARGRLGLGEGYVAGDWDSDDLPGLLATLAITAERVRRHRVPALGARLARRRPRLPARADLPRSRREIAYHYDLGNDLYALFLDPSMTYSCAVFEHPEISLEEAQAAKRRRLLERLDLRPGQRLLEIGCGWGALSIDAARDFGVHATGITLSQEQAATARARAAEAGVGDEVDIRLVDYRRLSGRFDRIVSVEMIEAVAHSELPGFLGAIDRHLASDGLAALQMIAIPEERYERYRRGRDWIREYIFPGGSIPSLAAFTHAMGRGSELIVDSVENIGDHYAPTLEAWRTRFLSNADAVRALGYDDRFIRGWEFYLAFCEAGFATRALHDYQLVLSRPFRGRVAA
ncbi:MAG: DUF1365 family protein [Miltoncostaeaceae bacterium]